MRVRAPAAKGLVGGRSVSILASVAPSLRVLIVDDRELDASLICESLIAGMPGPIACERAATGADALARLERGAFDLCLLDYHLGDESGLDVLRALRARGLELPVVVLTAASAHEIDVAASDAGADDYLDKARLGPELLEHSIRYARSRRRMLVELRAQNRALEALSREKNVLLGMAAHDLRNPIGVVRGYAEFLASNLSDLEPSEAREILETMRASCAQMSGLIDDLLDVSAIEAGTLELRRAPTDVVALVRTAIARQASEAATKNIAITLLAEPVPLLELDRERFDQVLTNLIGNALKYSNAGKPVRVRVRPRSEDRVELAVEDEGIGIGPAFLPKLFQPFQRAARTGTSGEKSTGLGLAIVRRIVEAHGGTIGVTSEPGVGSTFTVSLPSRARD